MHLDYLCRMGLILLIAANGIYLAEERTAGVHPALKLQVEAYGQVRSRQRSLFPFWCQLTTSSQGRLHMCVD